MYRLHRLTLRRLYLNAFESLQVPELEVSNMTPELEDHKLLRLC